MLSARHQKRLDLKNVNSADKKSRYSVSEGIFKMLSDKVKVNKIIYQLLKSETGNESKPEVIIKSDARLFS